MISFVSIFLVVGSLNSSELENSTSIEVIKVEALHKDSISEKIVKKTVYLGTGTAFGIVFLLAKLGAGVSFFSSSAYNECQLFSEMCSIMTKRAFSQLIYETTFESSHSSWERNQKLLSQVPTSTKEEEDLVYFLSQRWLAKFAGHISVMADWLYPFFGSHVEIHPETTHSYARNIAKHMSKTYLSKMESLKQLLPHPKNYPLLLTRSYNIHEYLPSYISASKDEKIESIIEKTVIKAKETDDKIILDLTSIFSSEMEESGKWKGVWDEFQSSFSKGMEQHEVNPDRICLIQGISSKENIDGIRILPMKATTGKGIWEQNNYLLEKIAFFGLAANMIELDRYRIKVKKEKEGPSFAIPFQEVEEFVSYLDVFEKNWTSNHLEKTFMVKSALHLLRSLFKEMTDEKWKVIKNSATKSGILQVALFQIKDQLKILASENEDALFFATVSHVEQIHAGLCTLLEILDPFDPVDFPSIYENLVTSIPASLKPLTSYGLHTSAMTSFAAIIKAVSKSINGKPLLIYGENTYFECVDVANYLTKAVSMQDAVEKDWEEAHIILAQFNPVLRTKPDIELYRTENVSETVHRALLARNGKPLTLALDCTIDYINSPRIEKLICEFEEEIKKGTLNLIFYRSGLKYDIFGMDSYCGAPIYLIHNHDEKWSFFDLLMNDPILQTDHLSFNWFCLVYKHAGPQLELYRKFIFSHTKALLSRIPKRLINDKNARYQVVPFSDDSDPAFIDIKVSGPFHKARATIFGGGSLYLGCVDHGHPIFTRLSLGFNHPNFFIIFNDHMTNVRLTLGLDPSEIDLLTTCFEKIDKLNGTKRTRF
ncbi:MAG: hypothetical protein A3F67_10450 [Verrucomicrobia bacterium RIFCSPHIGHO2_12_FULL_41_10]|nr:MAG: hypothetical protein A3F67_10450 [Verrucomicrobia bacterium RIFCSPHIGHO2_12_FULL_41_10]